MAATAWSQLKHLRHRDLLLGTLLRAFERDQLESRVIQSAGFRPALTRWAELLLAAGKSGADINPRDVPPEVVDVASKGSSEVRWVVKRLASENAMHRGPAHFPSVLLQKGPQYPFQPFELTYLRSKVGSMRGTELAEKIELPETTPEAKAAAEASKAADMWESPKPRDLWAEGCLDDDDLMDHSKAPR
ncbi:unnamed protein product [Polarella glacialis]|uniref:Uncharacterized protein n=1 Tax=Polarella glacialis TaxID=89957 RepID=A0A813JPR6_POLGL|nr:unnamed protein product [Polarella glacialis]CAE8681342.1 unnamed protein product [Polarella glacialis]|mmetsp:Transcript_10417/g.18990  ORF Transcript_10417/g.18990 Transcript_10417/m.18990 type:complete len:189 (+) Transcript_10417:90-656(+)